MKKTDEDFFLTGNKQIDNLKLIECQLYFEEKNSL